MKEMKLSLRYSVTWHETWVGLEKRPEQEVNVVKKLKQSVIGLHLSYGIEAKLKAWKPWDEGNALELMDETLKDQFQNSEAQRCIQVGLLCVQENPNERPAMWSVLSMLESENMVLSQPKQPEFYTERMIFKTHKLPVETSCTSNKVTITQLDGR
uniref:S-locus receptor kinase C-terminal domain-containing protein n=1 Tax=Cucumis melo TaxID=3656 RepID=A0A9I9ELN9_CUCME